MVKKCRPIAEIAVVEVAAAAAAAQVGVKKRARALALATTEKTTAKKRKLNSSVEELELSSPKRYIQERNCQIVVQDSADDRCLSSSLDHDVSCCSSNGSSERMESPDLEAEDLEVETSTNISCSESRESTRCDHQPESDDLDSASKPSADNFCRRSPVEKIPTEAELEEFFSAAEKDIQKQFFEKYNYDILTDEPLEGRYDWVRLKP
ncbi:hypothetical protein SLE2022_362220 [Rubroshorea leprosula]